jgi:hypothetical protein
VFASCSLALQCTRPDMSSLRPRTTGTPNQRRETLRSSPCELPCKGNLVVSAVGIEPTTYRLRVAQRAILTVTHYSSGLPQVIEAKGFYPAVVCSMLLSVAHDIEPKSL